MHSDPRNAEATPIPAGVQLPLHLEYVTGQARPLSMRMAHELLDVAAELQAVGAPYTSNQVRAIALSIAGTVRAMRPPAVPFSRLPEIAGLVHPRAARAGVVSLTVLPASAGLAGESSSTRGTPAHSLPHSVRRALSSGMHASALEDGCIQPYRCGTRACPTCARRASAIASTLEDECIQSGAVSCFAVRGSCMYPQTCRAERACALTPRRREPLALPVDHPDVAAFMAMARAMAADVRVAYAVTDLGRAALAVEPVQAPPFSALCGDCLAVITCATAAERDALHNAGGPCPMCGGGEVCAGSCCIVEGGE